MPRPITSKVWKGLHGRRSSRAGIKVLSVWLSCWAVEIIARKEAILAPQAGRGLIDGRFLFYESA